MKYLLWLLRLLVFAILLGFAIRNVDPVTVRFYLGNEWQAPLALVLLIAFVLGAIGGVLASLGLMFRKRSEEVCGLPAGSDSAKVREGKAGSKRILSEATLKKLETAWQEEIEDALGFKDYASLIAELK